MGYLNFLVGYIGE